MAILKSERFFSSVNYQSGKWLGSSKMYYMKPLKIAHTYTFFDEKFLWIRDSFRIMILWIFSMFYMRIMQSENFATDIHAHYRQSETAPIYTRIICEKNFAQIYMKNRGAFEIGGRLIEYWCLFVRLYHVLYMWASFEECRFLLIG